MQHKLQFFYRRAKNNLVIARIIVDNEPADWPALIPIRYPRLKKAKKKLFQATFVVEY